MNYSVIVPFYNEEKNISRFNIELTNNIKKLTSDNRLFEIIYVDDGSVDNTFDELRVEDVIKIVPILELFSNFSNKGIILSISPTLEPWNQINLPFFLF